MPFPGHLASLKDDSWLTPYQPELQSRADRSQTRTIELTQRYGVKDLVELSTAYRTMGLQRIRGGWSYREWAPNSWKMWLVGDFSDWKRLDEYEAKRIPNTDIFELKLKPNQIKHGDFYHVEVAWPGGEGDRIPAYAQRVVQDPQTSLFAAQVWAPKKPYAWQHDYVVPNHTPIIYEAHVGMSQEAGQVSSYADFTKNTLPYIKAAGYNTVQLMAIMEHPYYGSFGYHVSNFFAASSRFGTPEELKALIDTAHGMGLSVIMDLVHSHAVKNERDGLGFFDGTPYQYFHDGGRGWHSAWDSRCFDYAKPEVLRFLLSNCRYWLDEYRFDGYRFDGITSMLYHHHGLGVDFVDYGMYFGGDVDNDAVTYLALANSLIHKVRPDALTIAEDVSGMPGACAPANQGGLGFDYRLAMGIPEFWFKLVKKFKDEDWPINGIWYELTNKRRDERTISYVESHDQALVGGKSFIFEMIDKEMYFSMHRGAQNLIVSRGLTLHKMARLATLATSGAYLTFMGNEFGHPEWIDFPREGNNNSYQHARRQWSLRHNPDLVYQALGDFDQDMMHLFSPDVLDTSYPRLILAQDQDKVLAFFRGNKLVIFNFHPVNSYEDYELIVPPGHYQEEMNSDDLKYAGFGRIAANQEYPVQIVTRGQEHCMAIRLYLPAHTALVINRTPPGPQPKR